MRLKPPWYYQGHYQGAFNIAGSWYNQGTSTCHFLHCYRTSCLRVAWDNCCVCICCFLSRSKNFLHPAIPAVPLRSIFSYLVPDCSALLQAVPTWRWSLSRHLGKRTYCSFPITASANSERDQTPISRRQAWVVQVAFCNIDYQMLQLTLCLQGTDADYRSIQAPSIRSEQGSKVWLLKFTEKPSMFPDPARSDETRPSWANRGEIVRKSWSRLFPNAHDGSCPHW